MERKRNTLDASRIMRAQVLKLMRYCPHISSAETADVLNVSIEDIQNVLDEIFSPTGPSEADELLSVFVQLTPLIMHNTPVDNKPANVILKSATIVDTEEKYYIILLRSGGDKDIQEQYFHRAMKDMHNDD